MSTPASDWVSAFPEDDEIPQRKMPPARQRTRSGSLNMDLSRIEFGLEDGEKSSETKPTDDVNANSPNLRPYEVGYKRPPVHSRYKPGQSGNPRGRPKQAKGLNTLVREALGRKLQVRTASGTKKLSTIEVVLQKTLERAMKGDARAQLELIKFWKDAVPDTPKLLEIERPLDQISEPEDLAILDAYKAGLALGDGAT